MTTLLRVARRRARLVDFEVRSNGDARRYVGAKAGDVNDCLRALVLDDDLIGIQVLDYKCTIVDIPCAVVLEHHMQALPKTLATHAQDGGHHLLVQHLRRAFCGVADLVAEVKDRFQRRVVSFSSSGFMRFASNLPSEIATYFGIRLKRVARPAIRLRNRGLHHQPLLRCRQQVHREPQVLFELLEQGTDRRCS